MKKYKPGMKSPELPWGSPSLEYRICNQSPCDTPEQKILLYLCCLKQAFAHPMIGRTEGYTDAQLRAVFQHYKHIELYNLLKRYPRSTYLNSHKPSQPPKQNYCLVDIVSIFAILRLSKARDISVLNNYEIFLTLLFYLKEEQVLDDMFMAYFSPRFQSGKFMNMMLKGNNGQKEQLTLLIIDLMRSVLREIGMKASMQFQREKDILFELYPFYMSQRGVMLRRVQKPVAIAKKFVKDSLQNVQQSIRQQQQQQQKQQQQQLQQQQQQQQQSIRQYRKLPRQLSSIYQYSSRYEDDRASSWEYRVMGLESQLWFQSMIQQQLPDPLEIQQQLPDPPEIPEQIPDAPAIPEQVREPDHRQEVVPNAEMIQEICHEILEERMEQQEAMEDEDMRTPRTQRIKKRKNPGKTKFITLWNLRSPTR